MEKIIFNDNNLSINNIDDKVVRARVVIVDSLNNVIISFYNKIYLFPGGKIDKGEFIEKAAEREVKEETGIELNLDNQKPFLLVRQFIEHYPSKRLNNTTNNRLMETYYYLVYVDKINIGETVLSDSEKNDNFEVMKVPIKEIQPLLEKNDTSDLRNEYYTREIEAVITTMKRKIKRFKNSFD